MARKKTSAEKAREDAENEKVENMLDGAFGTLSGLETNKPDESISEEEPNQEANAQEIQEETGEILPKDEENDELSNVSSEKETIPEEDAQEGTEEIVSKEDNEDQTTELTEDAPANVPPSGPPSKGPPSGPPSKGPPSGPPSKGPPSGPPSKGPPSGPPSKGPPSGPPSKGPPSGPPSNPPSESTDSENVEEESPDESVIEAKTDLESVEEVENDAENSVEEQVVNDEVVNLEETEADDSVEEPYIEENEPITDEVESETSEEIEDALVTEEVVETNISSEISEGLDLEVQTNVETEAEIARLSAEVERLRRSMAGAAEVIEELENPPMPPAVMDNLVIGAHIVGDMARLARQLDREQLIRASMGTIAMLHPEQLEIIVSTKHMALLPRMDERDICAAKLGVEPPRGAPTDWRVLEVVLASVSLITGGPAAVIHSHGPFTTAASCEKDLVLVQPIDEIGKKHIGKIIIVDPDDENPEEFLRQVAEALQQGGMRCVVIRGMGAYSVGADLDQAWANAAMLEHSMKIVLLARQANLKV